MFPDAFQEMSSWVHFSVASQAHLTGCQGLAKHAATAQKEAQRP